MQEEIENKSVALSIKTAKLTANVLKAALIKALAEMERQRKNPKVYKGKQSVKHLVRQGAGVSNIEITDGNIKSFEKVARKYGMIQTGVSTTAAVRAVFFIDPMATIRAVIYYPMQLGRNFDELKRVLVGLQTIDKYHVALPADWRPGDDIIVPAPTTYDGTDKSAEGMKCYDWYFCTKPLAMDKAGQEKSKAYEKA